MRRTFPAFALLIAIPMTATLLLACGNDNKSAPSKTPTTAATLDPAVPSATPVLGPNELGEAPIFWRMAGSPVAGEPYKIVFRVTNGYAEDTLPIEAKTATGTGNIAFDAGRVAPAGDEGKGTFYAVNVVLPRQGSWQLTATAGADKVSVNVEVGSGGGSTG